VAERDYKLIFAGSMGAGKTTAIAAISEIPPVSTDVRNTDLATHSKATTTTAMDYGEITLHNGGKLRLYGTPGQERFDFMWKILSRGALGIVLLVDNSRPDPIADMRTYLDPLADVIQTSRLVVGVGRTDSHSAPSIDDYYAALAVKGISAPVFSVDVRERAQVLLLLDALFNQIESAERSTASASAIPQ